MKSKYILSHSIISLLEGILGLFDLRAMSFTPTRGGIVNYATLRWILAGALLLFLIALTIFIISLFIKPGRGEPLSTWLDDRLVGAKKRLFFIQGALIVLAVFLGECFLMTYLALPEPARPLFLWAALICLQTWLIFRLAYAGEYRQRPCDR